MTPLRFIVTGHPRGGTGYMAMLFQALGYQVGHETVLSDGISSWTFAVPYIEQIWCKFQRRDYVPMFLVHAVRNPFTAIPSIAFSDRISEPIRARHVLIDPEANTVERAAQSWIGWHQMLASQNPDLTVQIEHAAMQVQEWLGSIGYPIHLVNSGLLPSKDYNRRDHQRLGTGEILERLRPQTRTMLERMAMTFGYDQDESPEGLWTPSDPEPVEIDEN